MLDVLYPTSLAGYNSSAGTMNPAIISVSSGATLMFGVGGPNSFTSSEIDYFSTNVNGNNILPTGANLGFDTSAATAAVTYSTNLTNPIGITKWGAGLLTLTGSNTYSGATTVTNGTLSLSPATTASIGGAGSALFVAYDTGDVATLNVGPGTTITANNVFVGSQYGGAGGVGTVNQTGGVLNNSGVLRLGGGGASASSPAIGVYNLSGGTVNTASAIMAINNNSSGTLNVSGNGVLNVLNNGTLQYSAYYSPTSTVNQTGGLVAFYSDSGATLGGNGGLFVQTGTNYYNLNGGTLSLPNLTLNGGTLNLNLNGGVLQASAGTNAGDWLAGFSGSVLTNVGSGGAIIDTHGNAVTINNALVHSGVGTDGGLTLNDSLGTGSLTLTASSNYTGPTTITSGTLALGSGASIGSTSAITVNGVFEVSAQGGYSLGSLQTLSGTGTVNGTFNHSAGLIVPGNGSTGGTLTFNGPLSLEGGNATFNLSKGTAGSNALLVANGGLNIYSNTIFNVNFASFPSAVTTYTLVDYTGTLGGSQSDVSLGGNAGGRSLAINFNVPQEIQVTYTPGGVAANLTWASTNGTNWDVQTSSNWHNPTKAGSGANDEFYNGDNVSFSDSGSKLATSIYLPGTVSPGSVTVNSNTNDFTFSGGGYITGATGLTKSGSSTLTVQTNNNYSGPTAVNAGSLIMSGNNSLSGNVTVTGGTLTLQSASTLTGTTAVNGGTFVDTGASTFDGPFNVNRGLAVLQDSSLTASVSVNGGVLNLAGNQSFAVGPSVNNGGLLLATNTYGSADGGAGVTVNSGGTLQIGDNTTYGAGNLTGPIVNNGVLLLNRPDAFTLASNISGSSALTQTGSGTTTLSGVLTYTGTTIVNAGTLQANAANEFPAATTVSIANLAGATFALNNLNQTIGRLTGGGANGGIVDLGNSTNAALTISGATSGTFAGSIVNAGNLTVNGSANVTLTGANTYTGNTTVATGTLSLTPSTTTSIGGTGGSSNLAIGTNAGNVAVLNVGPGTTINVSGPGYAGFQVGSQSGGGGGVGTVNQTGGVINALSNVVHIGGGGSSSNTYATGTYNLSGGTLNAAGLIMAINNYSAATLNVSGNGVLNILDGNNLQFGAYYAPNGTINQSGGTVAFYADNGSTLGGSGGIYLQGGGTLTYNLAGGLLSLPNVTRVNSTAVFNLNGGVLQASTANSDWLAGYSGFVLTYVGAGGAIIDSYGNAVTITNSLTHSGSGADGGLTLNDSLGTGSLTLTGSSNYNGPTNILSGTLVLGSGASLPNTSGFKVNSALDVSALAPFSIGAAQTLTGTGTVYGAVNYTAGTISAGGITSGGTLTFNDALDLNGGTVLFNLTKSAAGNNGFIAANGGLNIDSPSTFEVDFSSFPTTKTTYTIASYAGTIGGSGSTDDIVLGGNVGGRSLTVSYSIPNEIQVTYSPGGVAANLTWASTSNSNWDVQTTSNWHNPSKSGSGANDTFYGGDNVTFADVARVQTSVQIDGLVAPGSILVTANTANYVLSGAGAIAGATSLTKSGNSTFTVNTANNYSGATNVYAGTLLMNGDNTLNGNINVSGGTLSLQGANTIGGITTVSGGTFLVGNSNTINGPVTVNSGVLNLAAAQSFVTGPTVNGGVLLLTNTDSSAMGGATTTIGSGGTLQLGDNATAGAGILSDPVVNNGVVVLNRPDSYTFSSNVSGSGSLVQAGSGTTIVAGSNSLTGAVLIKAGEFQVGSAFAVGAAQSVVFGHAVPAGTIFDLGGYDVTLASLSSDPVAPGGATVESNEGTNTLTISGTSNSPFSGTLQDGNGQLALNITATGNLTLVGTNTFSGPTDVQNGGVLTLANTAALLNSTLNIHNGATLQLRGNTSETFALPTVNAPDPYYYLPDETTVDVGALSVGHTGNTLEIPGMAIAHSTTFNVTNNSNDGYALSIDSLNVSNSIVTFNNGAALSLGTLQVQTNGGAVRTDTQTFVGSGNVTIGSAYDDPAGGSILAIVLDNPAGVLNLTGTSTFSGPFTVEAGTAYVSGELLDNGAVTVSGGTLVLENSSALQEGSSLTVGNASEFPGSVPADRVPSRSCPSRQPWPC